MESEVTKGHLKKGREDSLTPFDLLRQSIELPKYGFLFREFADAFKGKKQLFWSKGLKELLGIESKTDEEILEETDKDSIVIDELAFEVFQLISLHSMQADYLEFVELDYLDKGNRAKGLIEKLLLFEIERITQNANTT